jgi:hypothetical protein
LLNAASLAACRLQAVSSKPTVISMCAYFIMVLDEA